VYVDIVGTVPPADVTNKFLADPSPDKRAKMVDTLLASPEYAQHWMNYWDDVLMGSAKPNGLTDRIAFRHWLRGRFAQNASWDRIVTDLVTATGENGGGGKKMKAPGAVMAVDEDEEDVDPKANGAVNWTLRFEQSPQDLGGTASRVFLGVQIQCAQCHDHKTEAWKQDDYRRFASGFLRARIEPLDRGKAMGNIKRVDVVDIPFPAPRFSKMADVQPIMQASPRALDGTDVSKGKDTRKALAAWMTGKKNPWFAKAFANRMWGHFLGRGFIDPVDDIRVSNPATTPALLDALAADFAANDFDIKHLIRTITATEAYQLAASASAKTDAENKLWARFHLVPLGPEELLNAIFRVTDLEHTAEKLGVRNMDALRTQVIRQYAFLFDTDEEDDEPDYSGTVTQALTLLNGALVAQGARALPGSMTAELVNGPGTDEEKIDKLTLRVLARKPTADERAKWVAYVNEAAPAAVTKPDDKATMLKPLAKRAPAMTAKASAYEDLLWMMLNSSEFTFNH
jgi:hypothetical protein